MDRAGGTGGCTNKCQFMIYSYKDLHYDVLNIGRQEVWMGKPTLQSIIDTTKSTKFISANLLERKSGKPFVDPYVIKDYGNMRVGILGLLNEADFPAGSSMIDSVNFKVGPYADAMQKYVPMLAKKADVVVLLCELPSTALDSIIPKYPQVNVVISSGALKNGEQPTKIGHTQIVGTGSSGYSGHFATLELNPAWRDSIAFTNFNDFLTDSYEIKGEWADRLNAFNTNPPPNPPIPGGQINAGTTPPPPTKLTPSSPGINPNPNPGTVPSAVQPSGANTPQKTETGH